LLTLDVLLRL
jgi:hypothetical protein